MEIVIDRTEILENWNIELESFRGSIFMTKQWLDAISGNERDPIYLRFVKDGEVLAVLGGLELLNANGTAKQLFFYSGIASKTKDPELIRKCKLALYVFAKKNKYYRVSMRSYDHNSYVPAKLKQFNEYQRIEYLTFLNKSKIEVINNVDKNIRRKARKAKKEGVILKNSYSTSLTDKMFELLDETYNVRQSKGYGKYSYLYIPLFKHDEINKLVAARHASFYYAEYKNEILCIQLVFTCQKRSYCIFTGTSLNGYKLHAPSFLFYEVFQALNEQGYLYLNHGGIPRGSQYKGVKKFKENLGTECVASAEEVTNFITFPLYLLNPLLTLRRVLLNSNIPIGIFKRVFIKMFNLILQNRDQY